MSALPRALRPREKLLSHGPGRLGTVDLLALVLGGGTRRMPALELAARLVRRHGPGGLGRFDAARWAREPGIGPVAAARLVAAFELGRRAELAVGDGRPVLGRPADAWRQVRRIGHARREQLVGLYLDAQNALLHRETISVGSLNTTRTHPREILFPAVQQLALGFILAHNHPSGSPDPSPEDIDFTRAVRRAGELMGIELYDHLIVTRRGFTSLRERGLL